MQDEGMAREIVNRIQKLRKKAHLVPTDQISVYYNISPEDSDLNRVATEYRDFIEVLIKSPLLKSDSVSNSIASETQEVNNTSHITIFYRKILYNSRMPCFSWKMLN